MGASGPRLPPAMSDTKAVMTISGALISERPVLPELKHHFGKDAAVVAKELDQQPDQQAAEGAD